MNYTLHAVIIASGIWYEEDMSYCIPARTCVMATDVSIMSATVHKHVITDTL
jgi:hypothetical protein